MIRIEGISKAFAGRMALRGVDLCLEGGKVHVLLGSSGSGKSTLLRILLGLIPADEGSVLIDGQRVSRESQNAWAHKIGYVPQDGGLFPHLSARANVTLVAQLRSWPKSKIADRLAQLTAMMGLQPSTLDQFPSQLSGGQRQRVAFMRAAFLDPIIMVLDEPLGALDPLIRSDLQVELKGVFQALKKTVVLVTHDLSEAAFLGDTITLLHSGQVIQFGTMRELHEHPKAPFVTQFIQAQKHWSQTL